MGRYYIKLKDKELTKYIHFGAFPYTIYIHRQISLRTPSKKEPPCIEEYSRIIRKRIGFENQTGSKLI